MKPRTLTLISLVTLLSLLLGAYAITVLSAPKELKLKVMWKPATYVLNTNVPDPWTAEVFFAPPRTLTDIDYSTIELEYYYKLDPLHPPAPHPTKDRLNLYFKGYDVLYAIFGKMPHMGPGTYVVPLDITGKLVDGITPFKGTGTITIIVDNGLPP